jgi:hypothetical protein
MRALEFLSSFADRTDNGLTLTPISPRWDLPATTAAFLATAAMAAVAVASATTAQRPLAELSVYFDGHLYLDIARSFPRPLEPGGLIYSGHAPAYPFLIHLLHATGLGWGHSALVVSWVCTGATAGFLSILARELGLPRTGTVALYFAAYPYVSIVGATAHAEPLALAAALGAAVYAMAGAWRTSMLLLAVCVLARFPTLSLLPAFALLSWPSTWTTLAWMAAAPMGLGLWNAWLRWRIPGFKNVLQAHSWFWRPHLTWPFSSFVFYHVDPYNGWACALLVGSVVAAFFTNVRGRWAWAVWVATLAGFHLCLSDEWAVSAFARLAMLAWPAAVILLAAANPFPRLAPVACFAALLYVVPWVVNFIAAIAVLQEERLPFMAETRARLETEEPVWIPVERYWQ